MPKLVVTSNEIAGIKWGDFEPPRQLIGPDIEQQIATLKAHEGGDIITFGSPTLVRSLANANLVDKYRILIHPVIVREGQQLFAGIEGRKDLRLKHIRTVERGATLVHYEAATSKSQ